ncbi:MAG: cytochrome [Pseudomonadota bacterium]|nr:cytochrome [Pseudomonadota bacterium]
MLLQGNLQAVFDALYFLGVIDPVLKMDWQKKIAAKEKFENVVNEIIDIANKYNKTPSVLQQKLGEFDKQTLGFLAMEVAKEYADYHWRKTLH